MNDPRDMDMDDMCGGADQGDWGSDTQEDWQYDAYKEACTSNLAVELNEVMADIARSSWE
jgi:hypothetical protein